MFTLNDDLSIYATRGDIVFFSVTAEDNGKPYVFQAGDVVRFKVFGKKDAESVVLQKDFPITADTDSVAILLTEEDTKIGDVISKHKDYWYEVELNPFTNPQTIIGYDEDGAKVFRLFPEGDDVPPRKPIKPEDIPIVDKELDMTSTRPVENQAIARAIVELKAGYEETEEALAVERSRIDNLIANDDGVSQPLEYLGGGNKMDGGIVSDGVYATITLTLREANLFISADKADMFVIPNECRPLDVGHIHTDLGMAFDIRYDTENNRYVLAVGAAEEGVYAPTEVGIVTMSYALADYELKDIRVGADGTIYPTAGEAVREQFAAMKEAATVITPQMYGAVGDGVTDDTEAIRRSCDCGMPVVFDKKYSLSGTIEVKSKITIECGAVVYVDADVDAFVMSGENRIICGDGLIQVRAENYSHTVVTMGGGCKGCVVDGISVKGVDAHNCYGTAIACTADTARLFSNKIHANIECFDVGILLDAKNYWLNCFDIKAVVNYCNIGVKQIGNYENGYHHIDITGQACFYTEGGCGLYCGENGGKCHYRLNIVDTGRVDGEVKYNTILAVIKSDNNCIEIPYAGHGIYVKDEGRKNRFINEPSYTIAASDNILNNIDNKEWCKYEPINLESLTGANLFSYPKAKATANYMLRYTPTSDNDGARITLTLPRAINPSVLGIVCTMNQIPKRMVITFSSNDGTETVEIPHQVYEEGVFLPLTRYFTWKPLYQTNSITIECYGSNRGYDGQGAGLIGLMLNDNLLGGCL